MPEQHMTEQEFLAQYRASDYPRPSLTVDMAVFTVSDSASSNYRKLPRRELRVLLIKRGGHPFLGQWALPGGFVRPDETVGGAAARELAEETGVENIYLRQLYTFSTPGRDPRTWVVSCAHLALVDSASLRIRGGDDADEAAWFHLTCKEESPSRHRMKLEHGDTRLTALVDTRGRPQDGEGYQILENEGLAFDHAKILLHALLELRREVEASPAALHLVPEQFTLTQLQQVYEEILGKPLLAAAFRRKVAHLVEETDASTEGAGHRPSRLYRRKISSEEGLK